MTGAPSFWQNFASGPYSAPHTVQAGVRAAGSTSEAPSRSQNFPPAAKSLPHCGQTGADAASGAGVGDSGVSFGGCAVMSTWVLADSGAPSVLPQAAHCFALSSTGALQLGQMF